MRLFLSRFVFRGFGFCRMLWARMRLRRLAALSLLRSRRLRFLCFYGRLRGVCGLGIVVTGAQCSCGCVRARRHLQNHLLVVAKVYLCQLGILLTPLSDVGFVTLVAIEEMILSEVREDVPALLWHQDPRIFRID